MHYLLRRHPFSESALDTPPQDKEALRQAAKRKKVVIIDKKRAMNASISLARVKLSFPAMRSAITQMDDKPFGEWQIQALLEYLPTPAEVQALANYKGDRQDLTEGEQFMCAIMSVKNASKRWGGG